MLNADYLSLIQDKYTTTLNSNFTGLSDLSSLLTNSKTNSSSSDYAQKIVDVASSDAKNDIDNKNMKSWQNSQDYYNLKDEYVSSGLSSQSKYSSYADVASQMVFDTFMSFFKNDDDDEPYLTKINRAFAKAMNEKVTKTFRETEFDLQYNYAYEAYKTGYTAMQQQSTSSLDVTV